MRETERPLPPYHPGTGCAPRLSRSTLAWSRQAAAVTRSRSRGAASAADPGVAPPSVAMDISEDGRVVGVSEGASGEPVAVVWHADRIALAHLAPPAGFEAAHEAVAISPSGRYVEGVATRPGARSEAVRWEDGAPRALGAPGRLSSYARGVNDHGQVVGHTLDRAGRARAFLWRDGEMLDLETPNGFTSDAYDINAGGLVVGMIKDAEGVGRGVVWTGGATRPLARPAADARTVVPRAINDAGQVAGYWSDGGERHGAVLWDGRALLHLDAFPGTRETTAEDIDDRGQVVGQAWDATGRVRAFLWRRRDGLADLGGLPGSAASVAFAINGAGQVAGFSRVGARGLAVVWQP